MASPLLSTHFDAFPFPILEMDRSGEWLGVNSKWQETFSLPGSEDSMGRGWRNFLNEKSLVRWERKLSEAAVLGDGFQFDSLIQTALGYRRIVFTVERHPEREGWMAVATEIDQSVEDLVAGYEQDNVAQRMAGQRWYSFFQESATGKAIVGLSGEMIAVNHQLCELFGYSESEMMQITPRDLRDPVDRERIAALYDVLLAGSPPILGVAGRYRKRNGDPIQLLVSFSLVKDSRGHPLYFAAEMVDDTARRDAETALGSKVQEIVKLNDELGRSNSELERFAFVASHDLQEPLRKIRVFGSRLEKALETSEVAADGRDYLTRMLSAAARMQQLIADLLDFSRPSSPLRLDAVDLTQLANDAASDFEATLEVTGGKIVVEDLPVVTGDASRLRQLLCNLIGNGLKFHGEERPLVKIFARPVEVPKFEEPDSTQKFWEIRVQDNGIGFNESDLPRLLEVFGRLHPKNRFSGTGIGLAICRKVAQEHGGDITAKSQPGEGATFIVTLPTRNGQYLQEYS